MTRQSAWVVAVIAVLAAASGDDIMRSDRFVSMNGDGRPVFVAGVDAYGAGQLVVYDAVGNEVFAVKAGQIISPPLKRMIAREVQAALTKQAAAPPAPPQHPRQQRPPRSSTEIPVEQPAIYGVTPVFKAHFVKHRVVDHRGGFGSTVKWHIQIEVTNTSPNYIGMARLTLLYTSRESHFTILDLDPNETGWMTVEMMPDRPKGKGGGFPAPAPGRVLPPPYKFDPAKLRLTVRDIK